MKFWVGMFVLFGLVSLVVWEVVAFMFFENATVSVFATDLNYFSPIVGYSVAMIFGILIGHWFIPAKGSKDD